MFGGIKLNNSIDLTEDIQFILKSTQALEGRFGLAVIICFICGKKNDKLQKRMLTNDLYGKGKYATESYWKALSEYT